MTVQSTDPPHTFAARAAIQMESLSKHYGDFVAVEGLTLSIANGEVFGLLGPNGAGKTTTMRMLMGLLCATRGSARIAGLDTFEQRAEVMRHVGYLPDEPVFYDYLRGTEIIYFVGEMHGLPRSDIDERTRLLLARLQLDDAISDYAVNYSRGMKKKLGLMLALLHDPDVLILDEPTNGLDPHATRQVHDIVRERRDRGKTALLSTHLLEQAQKLCTSLAILHKGRVVAAGSMSDLTNGVRSLEDLFFQATESAGSAPTGTG
jgi:ABC-2 type transport system ATP-binding protein